MPGSIGIRARLVLWVGLVVVGALAGIAIYSSQVAQFEFERLEEIETVVQGPRPDLESLRTVAAESESDWSNPQALVDRLARTAGAEQRVLLFDPGGRLLAGAPPPQDGQTIILGSDGLIRITDSDGPGSESKGKRQVELKVPILTLENPNGGTLGSVAVYSPPETSESPVDRRRAFSGSLNRWLVWGLVVAGAAALLLTWFTGTRLLRPVAELKASAERMAAGDLDERVTIRTRDELGELAAAFNRMADSLARAEQARQDMINDTAHELRTPLTNVRCQLEAIQDGLVAPDENAITSLDEEIKLLSRLVDDLRDLSLASAGQLRLQPERLELAGEVKRAVAAVLPGHGGGAPEIISRIPADIALIADAHRLQQILRNLLVNAARHTPVDGQITVSAEQDAEAVRIGVSDTGEGIAPDQVDRVFDRFHRTDNSRSRRTGGAGLGLAIVRQLVAAHGGTITVESVPEQGTTFRILLPLSPTTVKPDTG